MIPTIDSLVECLGGPWDELCQLEPSLSEVVQKDGYRIEHVSYNSELDDTVPALVLIPDGVNEENSAPAVAVWHQHAGQFDIGKSEPAGLAGKAMHHTGVALAQEGYVVLCPDSLCFEERQDPSNKLVGKEYERFEFLEYVVQGKCLAWKNILDMKQAISYLGSRPEVDEDLIGCYGHSLGSTQTWLFGPHEPRLNAMVGSCSLPTYKAIAEKKLSHSFSNYVPGWAKFGDIDDIVSLIAPRPLHLNFGGKDLKSPIEFVKESIIEIQSSYDTAGVPENFSTFIQDETGHEFTDVMWNQTKSFFAAHLKK